MGATSRVAAGAAYLDENVPDWLDRIDTSKLSIRSCYDCILGQLFGDYFVGKEHLELDTEECAAYGFCAHDVPDEKLDKAWRKLITARRSDMSAEQGEEPKPDELDAFIQHWGADLQRMYENRTAGDHSFTGFVVALMYDMKTKGVHLP